jgi:hypothetical protein
MLRCGITRLKIVNLEHCIAAGRHRLATGQTRWIIANRNAVVSPNSSMPFSASNAPINCHSAFRNRFAWP